MKQLEDELGESIFVRHSKGIRLTEYGTIVLKQARDICDRIDFLHGTSQEKAAQRLTVASMFCSVANDAFADLVAEHPDNNFRMSIEECPLFQVIQRVGTGICRIGILTEYSENSRTIHHMLEENDLEYHVLSERTLGAIVGKNNPLYLTGRSEIELEELLRHPVLEEVAEGSIALGNAVLESEDRVVSEKLGRDLGDPLLGESLGSRVACCEGNYLGVGSEFQYFSYGRSLELAYLI